jgi:preprotein translocase subunit SecA
MEQSNSTHLISETQQRIIENLEKKVQHINFIAESYHLENKNLTRKNQELKIKVDRHKKISLIATTTAIILGLILFF